MIRLRRGLLLRHLISQTTRSDEGEHPGESDESDDGGPEAQSEEGEGDERGVSQVSALVIAGALSDSVGH